LDYVENPLDYLAIAKSIRRFIFERKEFLDQVWLEDKDIVNLHFYYEGENGNRTVGIIKGETLQNFLSIHANAKSIAYWADEETGVEFTLDTPVTEELSIIPVLKKELE